MVHIGEEIRKELHRQERTISWFARKLFCDRSNVYDIFKRKSIDAYFKYPGVRFFLILYRFLEGEKG